MNDREKISVTILTKDSSRYLGAVLTSLAAFPEVLLYDTGSKDETLSIAASYPNVKVERGPFLGFGRTHDEASKRASHDWIFSVDSDEIVTPELAKEILHLPLDRSSVYSVPRLNEYNGRVIRSCGWSPDRQLRLYNRKITHFDGAQVHEKISMKGMKEIPLRGALRHYSYSDVADFLKKMQLYSDLFAKEWKGKRKASPLTALGHAGFSFLKSYFLKRGFSSGYEGLIISWYNAQTAFYKYLKLWEANRRTSSRCPEGQE